MLAKPRYMTMSIYDICRLQVYTHTPLSYVGSDVASSRSIRRRSSRLERLEEMVSGGEAGVQAQHVAGLKRLTSKEQEDLLRDAGLRTTSPAAGSLLAIKADLNLSWSKIRGLKKWLRSFGVNLESERSARSFITVNIPSYTAMEVPMTKKNGDMVMTNMVYFPSLSDIVIRYLDWYESCGKLNQRAGIPEKQIWLKLGGDHGGGSFKFVMQIANVPNPNSLSNTVPVCVFEGQDSPGNLEIALGMFRAEVEALQTETVWNEHRFRVFFFGDYDFQTKSFGLSGSSGARPCVHCLCPKKAMDTAPADRGPSDSTERTLETLASDYSNFIAAGAVHSQAKLFNNVLRQVILPVPVQDVVIPALHLDLGIFPWLFSRFEAEVQQLDIKLAAANSIGSAGDAKAFKELQEAQTQLRDTEEQLAAHTAGLEEIQQQLEYVVLSCRRGETPVNVEEVAGHLQQQYQVLASQHGAVTGQKEGLCKAIAELEKSNDFRGPCTDSIEPVLQAHHIQRQAYHGGAFVGNHVHKALQPAVVGALVSAPLAVITTRSPGLVAAATEVKDRYSRLLTQYAECRCLFNHCDAVSEEEICQLETNIAKFMATCREEIVKRNLGHITPKLHLLESHTVPSVRRLRVGLGLLAEQGSESIHARFNSLQRDYSSIPNTLERLRAVSLQHLVGTLPQHEAVRPVSRKRKSEDQ